MIGRTLAHYEITALLGKGGMGEVYRARDTKLGRDVALKVLPTTMAHDPERLARFDREARTLASLQHPNVASVYGLETADGQTFLVMELVEGEDLSERLQRGALPIERVVDIAGQIATGLEAAHAKGVVHRDLKPANVKLGSDGTVKILDFGLARAFEGDPLTSGDPSASPTLTAAMTQAGVILGTAAYMAPEQARGKSVDHRADLWALGVITFELLTGKQLFAGETVSDTLASVLRSEIPWDELPAALPPSLRRVLTRCLMRDARQRQQAAGDARLDLAAAAEEAPGHARSTGAAPRGPALRWVALVVLLAVAGALFAGRWLAPTPDPMLPPGSRLDLTLCNEGSLFDNAGPSALLTDDGQTIVFLEDIDNNRRLMVRRLDEEQARPLSGTENAVLPFLSPDSKWVGFFAGSKLYKVWLGGGSPLEICRADGALARGAAWGPDDKIVFAANTASGLLIVDAAGGTPVPLTTIDETVHERSHRWPDFLPDGRHVVFNTQFQARNYHDGNIEVVDVATGQRRVVHRGGAFPRAVDAGHLVFVRENTAYMLEINADGTPRSEPRPVLSNLAANTGDETIGDGGAKLSVSAAGSILYTRGTGSGLGGQRRVAVVDFDGGIRHLVEAPGYYFFPRVSHDGTRVAVTSFIAARNEVWLFDLADGRANRVLSVEGIATLGSWSADDRYLYLGVGEWSSRDIMRLDLSGRGTATAAMTSPADLFPQDATQDGRWLIADHHTTDQTWDIVRIDLQADGETPRGPDQFETVLVSQTHPGSVRVSPDGRWVIHESLGPGHSDIVISDFNDPSRRWLISDDGGNSACFDDDGRRVFYIRGLTMMAVDLNPGPDGLQPAPPELLFEAPLKDAGNVWTYDKIPGQDAFVILLPVQEDVSSAEKWPGEVTLLLDWQATWAQQ